MIKTAALALLLATSTTFASTQPDLTRTTYVYKHVGDLAIKADVHRLNDREIRPVVVWLHGGALINGGRERISRYLQQLAAEGAIIVSLDYRLAPETKLPGIIEDVQDAFTWLRASGPELFHADPGRIAVWGESAGGYLTLTAGFRVQPAVQALVSIYGYGDLIGDWYSKPSPHPAHHKIRMLPEEARAQVSGPPIANSRDRRGDGGGFYQFCRQHGIWPKEVSGWDPSWQQHEFHPYMAIKNISRDYPPTFLIHGDADTDVPHEQSVLVARQLARHDVEHEFIRIANGEHGFRGADSAEVEAAYQAAIAFTKKELGLR